MCVVTDELKRAKSRKIFEISIHATCFCVYTVADCMNAKNQKVLIKSLQKLGLSQKKAEYHAQRPWPILRDQGHQLKNAWFSTPGGGKKGWQKLLAEQDCHEIVVIQKGPL